MTYTCTGLKHINDSNRFHSITFDKASGEYYHYYENKVNAWNYIKPVTTNHLLHKAIDQQLFELGWIKEVDMMENKEMKLKMFRTEKMFNLNKMREEEPQLFDDLCKDYPMKGDQIIMIEVRKDKK